MRPRAAESARRVESNRRVPHGVTFDSHCTLLGSSGHRGRPRSGTREVYGERRALLRPRLHGNPPALALDECLRDRKSTRLNSSHGYISYAVFCLKKKKKTKSTSNSKLEIDRRFIKSVAQNVHSG